MYSVKYVELEVLKMTNPAIKSRGETFEDEYLKMVTEGRFISSPVVNLW